MPRKRIKIELVHDIICSWCPIGYSNIKAALADYESQLDAEFKFLPYELNPEMPPEGEPIGDHLKRRNGWNDAQLNRYREELVKTASRAGLMYDFAKRTHYWNTGNAHTLMHLAEKSGKQEALNRALIEQYFTHGVNVSDVDSLAQVAAAVGLDRDQFLAALTSPAVAAELAAKRARVRGVNVRSVPTFIVNDSEVLRGSNSVDFFAQYLSDYVYGTAAPASSTIT